MSRHPEVKWAQRSNKVFITVVLPDSKNAKVNLEPDGVFTFSATAGAHDAPYEVQLELFEKVNVEASKINVGVRGIFCIVEKAEKGWWRRLLRGEGKPHYLKVDWDKWVDEDEENTNGLDDLNLGGMDFSSFGGMGDGGMGDFDDDDEEMAKAEEETKGEGVARAEEDGGKNEAGTSERKESTTSI